MAIIDSDAVFIIGAGASAIFGMPLGDGLIDAIAEQIKKEMVIRTSYNEFGSIVRQSNIEWYSILSGSQGGIGVFQLPYFQRISGKNKKRWKRDRPNNIKA